jgi:hypothetical protein
MFSSGMLHHLGDIQRALAGGYALLKPGGRWYIVNELSIGSIARSFWNSSWGEKGKWAEKTGIRENSYTLREWLHFFEQQNFQILEVHFHRNTKHKLLNWSRAAYYAFISKLPSLFMKMGVPCEVNFVLEKR